MGRNQGVLKNKKEPGILGVVVVQLCPGCCSCSTISTQPYDCEMNINICFPSADLSVLLHTLTLTFGEKEEKKNKNGKLPKILFSESKKAST